MFRWKCLFLVSSLLLSVPIASHGQSQPPPTGTPKITSVTPGGVGYAINSTDSNNYITGAVGQWDTAYTGGVDGPPTGNEPSGASTLTVDIDVNAGGKLQFNYAYQTYDGGTWDWYDISLVTPGGTVPIVQQLGYPVHEWGVYWQVPSTPVSIDLTQYKSQHVQLVFSCQQDGYGDQSQGTFDGLHITSTELTAKMLTSDDHQSIGTGDSHASNAYFPLGGIFEIVLQKYDSNGTTTDLSATFNLDSGTPAAQLDSQALFPSNVVMKYDQKDGQATVFEASHTGTHHLTITPDDSNYQPVNLTLNVTMPQALGTAHTDIDTLILPIADRKGIPPQYIKAQIEQESGSRFNPRAYRYEPLSGGVGDFSVISRGADLRATTDPYASKRLATANDCKDNALAAGATLIDADIAPRSIYQICSGGSCHALSSSDSLVSGWDIIQNNPTARWSVVNRAAYNTMKTAVDKGDTCNYVWTAQTSLSASYGYLQMLYLTAIGSLHWTGIDGGANNPSYLLDTPDNLAVHGGSTEVGTTYIETILRRSHSADVNNPQFDSENDLEDIFRDGWTGYNRYLSGYADLVLAKSYHWLPSIGQSIFTTTGGN